MRKLGWNAKIAGEVSNSEIGEVDAFAQRQHGSLADMHAAVAERAEELLTVDEAVEIVSRYTSNELIELARRGFHDPASITPTETRALYALARTRFMERNA